MNEFFAIGVICGILVGFFIAKLGYYQQIKESEEALSKQKKSAQVQEDSLFNEIDELKTENSRLRDELKNHGIEMN